MTYAAAFLMTQRTPIILTVIVLIAAAAGCYSPVVNDAPVNSSTNAAKTPAPTPVPETAGLRTVGQFEIDAASSWVNTLIDVPAGCRIEFSIGGKIDAGDGQGEIGPEGTDTFKDSDGYPVFSKRRLGLAAQITSSKTEPKATNRDAWAYGDEPSHEAKQAGRLWLAVNDALPSDNKGKFVVKIRACADAAYERSGK